MLSQILEHNGSLQFFFIHAHLPRDAAATYQTRNRNSVSARRHDCTDMASQPLVLRGCTRRRARSHILKALAWSCVGAHTIESTHTAKQPLILRVCQNKARSHSPHPGEVFSFERKNEACMQGTHFTRIASRQRGAVYSMESCRFPALGE